VQVLAATAVPGDSVASPNTDNPSVASASAHDDMRARTRETGTMYDPIWFVASHAPRRGLGAATYVCRFR
jgi:hypothetical protein